MKRLSDSCKITTLKNSIARFSLKKATRRKKHLPLILQTNTHTHSLSAHSSHLCTLFSPFSDTAFFLRFKAFLHVDVNMIFFVACSLMLTLASATRLINVSHSLYPPFLSAFPFLCKHYCLYFYPC